jgi:hypothetical protein
VQLIGLSEDWKIGTRVAGRIAIARIIIDVNIAGANGDRSTLWHRIACIDDEIDQCCFKFAGIDRDRPDIVIHVDVKLHGAAKPGVQHFPDGMNAILQLDGLRIYALSARKGTIRYLASNLPGHTTLIITAAQIALLAHYMNLVACCSSRWW